MRALVAGHDVGGEQAGVEQPAQRAVDGGVADLGQPGGPQATQDVVAVAVLVAQGGETGEVQHAFEELRGIHAVHTTSLSEVVSKALYQARDRAMPSRMSCSLASTEVFPARSMMMRRIRAPAPITSARPGCITGSSRRSATVEPSRSNVTFATSSYGIRAW